MKTEEIKDHIFLAIQSFLKTPPVIIWGSGATIPYGMASMSDLNKTIADSIPSFDGKSGNLEEELGKDCYIQFLPEIRKIIWKTIKEKDEKIIPLILKNPSDFKGIYTMIKKCIDAEPKVANIITTNYDRILEFVVSYYGISFTDGFNGRVLSTFNVNLFQEKSIVNLIKVHGSINWGQDSNDVRYMDCTDEISPTIIPPGKNKYREAYHMPYRELIHKADEIISHANSFFVVGFGFNDEHLTPKVKEKAEKGTPIVLITFQITDTAYKELQKAQKYILIEHEINNQTKVLIKNNDKEESYTIDGEYWQLNKFMEEIL